MDSPTLVVGALTAVGGIVMAFVGWMNANRGSSVTAQDALNKNQTTFIANLLERVKDLEEEATEARREREAMKQRLYVLEEENSALRRLLKVLDVPPPPRPAYGGG